MPELFIFALPEMENAVVANICRKGGVLDRIARFDLCVPLLLGLVVFLICLFGILTRPVGFLAAIWPANAVLLGLMIRMPKSAGWQGWLAAAVAYMAADLLAGSTLEKAALLNAANMAGVIAGYQVYKYLPAASSRLQHPASLLHLAMVSAIASSVAGIVGGIANPILFGGSIFPGWIFWSTTELVNYISFLPVVLSAPKLDGIQTDFSVLITRFRHEKWPPLVLLLVSCIAGALVGGPGAIAFPVPALLWCGLVYPVFPTSILTLCIGVWGLVILSNGLGDSSSLELDVMTLISIRLGISLVALAPIMLSCVTQNRNALVGRLQYLASHDQLTNVLNRSAFREEAARRLALGTSGFALLMVDLDDFKGVNDTHGHATGDTVLVNFVQRVKSTLPSGSLLGRMGGEEFAVLIPDCRQVDAVAEAENIRQSVGTKPLPAGDGKEVQVTASLGVVAVEHGDPDSLDTLLAEADRLCYLAKKRGRNRVEAAAET
ncbi:diguanylate cyclase [Roseibium sp. FZY0029]|uniref:GGDEF domain-containing protein n=1 Tax=Roseibium sp. FZY0029 TaxID=3116647 RepID=UPI002EA10363|nr:diguanylate cyclase [Roseibium sp. FZY0029]